MNRRTPPRAATVRVLPSVTFPKGVLPAAALLALALSAAGCQPRPEHYVEVCIELQAESVEPAAYPAMRAQASGILEKRFSEAGVEGILLRDDPAAANRLFVYFPGKTLPDGMPGSLLNQTKLELCLVHANATKPAPADAIQSEFGGAIPAGYRLVPWLGEADEAVSGPPQLLVASAAVITDADLKDARADQSQGKPSVSFTLVEAGAARFGQATEANVGRQLAILLDGQALSAPVIQGKITDSGIITGLESAQEADDLALCLRSHSLPAKVVILTQKTVPGTSVRP